MESASARPHDSIGAVGDLAKSTWDVNGFQKSAAAVTAVNKTEIRPWLIFGRFFTKLLFF